MADAKNVINGTYGTLWVNGEKWAECTTFDAEITINYSEVHFPNDGATYQKATGWSGSGSLTINKIYSRVQNAVASSVKSGTYPRFELVGKLADPDALGSERAAIHDVTFDKFTLLKFDPKKIEDEQVTFKFSDYDLLDTIPDPTS
ncbi:phage protein [Alicyclobacillus acidoterrestris]|nr:phage protein [Alicyclobacillus acidoterrestris]